MWKSASQLYTASGSRDLDRQALVIDELADGELMQRAGESAYRLLRFRWPRAKKILIVCGPGNNGGDGYVLACQCFDHGLQPLVVHAGDPGKQAGDAQAARRRFEQTACPMTAYSGEPLPQADVVVDALLGSGSNRQLTGLYLQLVTAINASTSPVLALDLPTGIDADTGGVLGSAVNAEACLCFVALKQGLLSGPALNHARELYFDELGVSTAVYASVVPSALRVDEKQVRSLLPHRRPDTHKGEQGRVLVVGGNTGMSGAAYMAGEAALRSGAGLVTLVLPSPEISIPVPEVIVAVRRHRREMTDMTQAADAIVIGPGLGSDGWAKEMLSAVLDQYRAGKLLIDAEGLNLLAAEPIQLNGAVITPHPGEAARLLGSTTQAIQQDRYAAVRAIASRYQCVCVLKGAGTLVSDGKAVYVCDRGHAGMATAGAGDVLSGVVAGLMAQGLSPLGAACAGIWLHAVAGESAGAVLGNGLIATDIMKSLPSILRQVSS